MSETQQLGVRIPVDLHRELKLQSERLAVPITWIVTDAIKHHLARLQKRGP